MKAAIKSDRAFTLVELLVVMAVIGILAGLLLPALSALKANAQRTACLDNLKQINAGIRMYCDDSSDVSPSSRGPWIWYKERIKNYVGLQGHSSPQDRIFACPADTFYYHDPPPAGIVHFVNAPMHDSDLYDYSSYLFNGFNLWFNGPNHQTNYGALGIAGLKLSSIREPVKTVLVAEAPAFDPFSWHEPGTPIQLPPGQWLRFNNAKDMVSFVDGHVSYIRMYYEEGQFAWFYDPPAEYDYKWSGN
jgi:prepilin-type N-terminal cleavage/methylation domain-containing protein